MNVLHAITLSGIVSAKSELSEGAVLGQSEVVSNKPWAFVPQSTHCSVHAVSSPKVCRAFQVLRSPMVMPLSKVGSGGSKDQRCVTIKEKLLLVSDMMRKVSVSEWGCQYFSQRCASGHYSEEKECGTGKALYLLYCLDFFKNPSPLVLSWRSKWWGQVYFRAKEG